MTQQDIEAHIAKRQETKKHLYSIWTSIVVLNETAGLSESTMKELQAKISSRIAQCDISIRDHERLLND